MVQVFVASWALFLGMFLLMIGNGLQGTLLGLRGEIEGFSTFEISVVEPWAWVIGRVIIGFCFCGVYITAESWLNDASDNENRGQALSIYMIVQMAGIVTAQYIVTIGDISFSTTKPMRIVNLVQNSPLSCVGMFMLGGVFAAQFGMSAVYGGRVGLSVGQISLFVSAIYIAALLLQYPIGWLSDRMDRRGRVA